MTPSPVKYLTSAGTFMTHEDFQKGYGLEVGSDQIGKYFSATEPRFAKDIQEYDELIVSIPLIKLLDAFREAVKQSVNINSFNRNDAKQAQLKADGFRTAKYSPHVVKLAADIDTTSPEQTRAWAVVLRRCAIDLGLRVRIGYKDYLAHGQTFIHVDVCPEYYAGNKVWHHIPHPEVWENVIEW